MYLLQIYIARNGPSDNTPLEAHGERILFWEFVSERVRFSHCCCCVYSGCEDEESSWIPQCCGLSWTSGEYTMHAMHVWVWQTITCVGVANNYMCGRGKQSHVWAWQITPTNYSSEALIRLL